MNLSNTDEVRNETRVITISFRQVASSLRASRSLERRLLSRVHKRDNIDVFTELRLLYACRLEKEERLIIDFLKKGLTRHSRLVKEFNYQLARLGSARHGSLYYQKPFLFPPLY